MLQQLQTVAQISRRLFTPTQPSTTYAHSEVPHDELAIEENRFLQEIDSTFIVASLVWGGRTTSASESHLSIPEIEKSSAPPFTEMQGQYLAFIYLFQKLHRMSPSESDMQQYFRVPPPSVHQMVLTLERRGLINRTPRQARSITLRIPAEQIPPLR